MIILELTNIEEKDYNKTKRKVRCKANIEFTIPVLNWCHIMKLSSLIRQIKDCIRITQSKNLNETIQNIQNPSELPISERFGTYTKKFKKKSN